MSVFFDVNEFYISFSKYFVLNRRQVKDKNISHKIICFDYGTHKIGFSVSDEELNFAFPKDVLIGNWIDIDNAFLKIKNICNDLKIKFIVFGFPKKMTNDLNENCKRIIEISNNLSAEGFDICLFDERFSTKSTSAIFKFEQRKNVNNRKKNNMQKNKYDDAMSASIILSDVLKIIQSIK